MTPNSSFTPPASREIHLHDYLQVLWRRKMTLAVTFVSVFLAVALYTFLMKPVYEAAATLHINQEKGKQGLLGELGLNATNPVNAELEILRSRTNAEEVVKRLHLDWKITDKPEGVHFKLREFISRAENPTYEVVLTGAGAFTVRDHDGAPVGKGQMGVLMQEKGVTLFFDDLQGKAGEHFRLTILPFNKTVEKLREKITADEVGKNTSVVRVSYTGTNPAQARAIVNALVQAYLEQAISFKTEEANRTVSFVEEQLQGLRGELDTSEKNLQTYKSAAGVVKLDTEAEELVKKISETEKARSEVILRKKQVEFALEALQVAMRRGGTYSPAVVRDDPLVAGMAAKLTDLEVQKRSLLSEYTEAHPAVKAIQEQVEEMQKKVQSTFETSLKNLAKQEATVTQQLAGYEAGLRKLPAAERDLARLTRVSKVNADIYTLLLQKHEEARIVKASTISNINIIDGAIVPDRPIKPRKEVNLTLGLLFGFMLGVGLAFFTEYLDDTIKDVEGAKRIMNLPLMAVIPFIPIPETGKEGQEATALYTQLEPKSQVAEAFRSLRTSLHFSAISRDKKIILITSTFPGEGKSLISANLAHTLSQTGTQVLIIDCDLRRSSLHIKFGLTKIPGLTELLTGDAAFSEACHQAVIPGIDLITAGTTPPNPSELLGSEPMRQLLRENREKYDYIIIDAPPVLAVTDAPVLTSLADMVILVMEVGRVPLKAAQHMREMLANVQAPVAGLVINDKERKGESYGYYGGKYYHGGYGGHGYGPGYDYSSGYGYYSDDVPKAAKVFWWKKLLPQAMRRKRSRASRKK